MSKNFREPSNSSIGSANIVSVKLTSKSEQYCANSEPIATYMKTAADFKETNPNRSRRLIYFRSRPVHGLVRRPVLRRLFQRTIAGHWAIEVGEYIWELENQHGVINYHVGVWTNPGDADGRRLLVTECEAIGDTYLTDLEIKETADQVTRDMNRKRALWGMFLLPCKIPLAIFKMFFTVKRYDEAVNNCQCFAARFAASIDYQTGISENRMTKQFGREVRITFNNAKALPLGRPMGLPPWRPPLTPAPRPIPPANT